MGIIAIVFMLGAGGALAAFVVTAMTIARREDEASGQSQPALHRDSVAASLLFHVAFAGGGTPDEALRQIRRTAGIAAPVTRGIDVGNWAETYARASSPEQRSALLETAAAFTVTASRAFNPCSA